MTHYSGNIGDFMWLDLKSVQERIDTARHFRVFPGEGVHSEALAEEVLRRSVPLPNQIRLKR